MIIVGISALFHDSACAVVIDGRPVAAAHEERFTRRRYDRSMPVNAFRSCLLDAGIDISDVDCVAYYEDPVAKLSRQLWAGVANHASEPLLEFDWTAAGMPRLHGQSLAQLDAARPRREIRELLGFEGPVHTFTHHESHAASAFYCSGFREAALFTADAVGEWTTTSYGHADDSGLKLLEEVAFPHSLGLFYSALTSYLGFAVNSDEYKVMALASAGKPRFADRMRQMLRNGPGGGFELEPSYFSFDGSDRMFTPAVAELLGMPPREPESDMDAFHEDVAASMQTVLEEVLLDKLKHLHELTGSDSLVYAGGVALNCVANSRIRRDGPFRDLFVQPASGDSGGALGAALLCHHRLTGSFQPAPLLDARLGPRYDIRHVRDCLVRAGVPHRDFAGDEAGLLSATAELLAQGAVVGWYQGRMEYGPRALGARSIIADPRDARMRDHINALVKKREAFRPFAPAVPEERCAEFFERDLPAPFMLETAQVRHAAELPAITHVDGSARVQTVNRDVDPRFHGLLTEFGRRTGYPILLNTSFNMRGEPIVCDASDALACFVRCRIDVLVLEDLIILREDTPASWAIAEAAIPRHPPVSRSDSYTFF
ncbi:carbamoyltransferase family protein [Nonomuraea sediminis]|uniref:carbamoyltransferase family protein n=1 Tax=Nonomuraea sediminis TaxID=2835864 RepID=UPI001BDC91FB|nr:carbamoyltransferase C-terminal domain-containing protein [Nonomuraea sediminis]